MSNQVLIVDDSVTIREQVKRALQTAGFTVLEAQDGVEGLRQVRGNPELTMVICDVNMPRMNGITMLEELHGEGSTVPVLMLTTEGQPDLIQRARAAGAKGWVIKPFEANLIVKAVVSLTKRNVGRAA